MTFSFATAQAIHFGDGSTARLLSVLSPQRHSPLLLLTGSSPQRHSVIADELSAAGFVVKTRSTTGEPKLEQIEATTEFCREADIRCVVAIGGGSVIDHGKAAAALAPNAGPVLDYLETVGQALPLLERPLPFAALPTTAGTGAEATRNAVISVPEQRIKVSLRSPLMLPQWAIVDPTLSHGLPVAVAKYTGMDAFIQNLEAYLSAEANPLTDAIAREGLRLAARSIRSACDSKLDKTAKSEMAAAALCSGIALANTRLGAIHGFAGPLGGEISAPHGAICAALLVPCLKANANALSRRAPQHPSLKKLAEVAQILTGNPEAKASYAIAWCDSLVSEFKLPKLAALGLASERIEATAKNAARSSSMQGNPIALTRHELIEILEEA